MASGLRGLVSSILRYAFRLFAALIVVAAVAAGVWLTFLGEAPPGLPRPSDAPVAEGSRTETAVTWVPRIGPRAYGSCTRILSLDGGGVRGLVPALILAEIEKRTGRPIYQQFDLIVGTSTGSILALGLTRPSDADARRPAFAAKDLVQLYRDYAARIFPYSYAPIRYLRRIFRPKFSPAEVEAVYQEYFGSVRLIEALTNVAVPAYDIEDGRRLWFQSYSSPYGDLFMRDVVRGATAAPTYFAPARFAVRSQVSSKGNVAIVDGALFANNPAQDALQFGQKLRDATSVLLVSIGTGRSSRKHSFEEAWGWGVLGWMDPLLEIAFSDPAIDDVMRRTLEGRGDYFRLQVDLGGTPVDIDDSSPAALERLEASTAAYLAKEADAISQVVNELSLPRAPQCGPALGADYERPEGPRERPTP